MPTPTYTALANTTAASNLSSVTFGSIPQTPYRDLRIVLSLVSSNSSAEVLARFNGNSSNIYHSLSLAGTGSTTAIGGTGDNTSARYSVTPRSDSTGILQVTIDILDYAATNKHKHSLGRASRAANGVEMNTNRWASTSGITSIQILPNTGTWNVGSTFCLYGIEA
jgi:hypothetical protein